MGKFLLCFLQSILRNEQSRRLRQKPHQAEAHNCEAIPNHGEVDPCLAYEPEVECRAQEYESIHFKAYHRVECEVMLRHEFLEVDPARVDSDRGCGPVDENRGDHHVERVSGHDDRVGEEVNDWPDYEHLPSPNQIGEWRDPEQGAAPAQEKSGPYRTNFPPGLTHQRQLYPPVV